MTLAVKTALDRLASTSLFDNELYFIAIEKSFKAIMEDASISVPNSDYAQTQAR